MPSATYTQISNVDGETENREVTKSADNVQKYGGEDVPIVVPAANAMLTYLNDDDGTASGTLSPGHTIVDGLGDLHWGTNSCRYGCTIDVTGDAIDLSGGAGDAFPADATPCTVSNQKQVDVDIDGDKVPYIDLLMTRRGHIEFQDAAGDVIRAAKLVAGNLDHWDEDMDDPNPYTGDKITVAFVTNAEAEGECNLRIKFLRDATP